MVLLRDPNGLGEAQPSPWAGILEIKTMGWAGLIRFCDGHPRADMGYSYKKNRKNPILTNFRSLEID